MDFWRTREIDNFDPCNALLAIATNILLWLVLCSRDTFFFFNIVLDLCPKAPECVRVEESAGTHAGPAVFSPLLIGGSNWGPKISCGIPNEALTARYKAHLYEKHAHVWYLYERWISSGCNCCMQYFLLSSQSSGPIETHPVCSRASTPRTPLWTPTWYSWGLGYFSKSWRIPAAAQKHIGIGEDDRHGVCGSVWLSRERPGSAGHQRGLGRRRSVRWSSFRFSCVRQVRWWRSTGLNAQMLILKCIFNFS